MSESNSTNQMKNLQAVSFALDDTSLFLDTYPFETEALNNNQSYREQRTNALKEYSENYGPLLSYDANEDNHWTWVENPWPWE